MFSSCRRLFQHRRSSSSRYKARSRSRRIDQDAAAATPAPGRHYAKRYHMIYLPDPASCVARYCFAARTGRRHSRPSVLTHPPVFPLPVRRASPGSSPRRSPLLFHFRRAGAGRWGLLVFGPSSCFLSFVLAVPKLLLQTAAAMLKMSYELLGMYSYQPARALHLDRPARRSCS